MSFCFHSYIGSSDLQFDEAGEHVVMLDPEEQFDVQQGDTMGLLWEGLQTVPFIKVRRGLIIDIIARILCMTHRAHWESCTLRYPGLSHNFRNSHITAVLTSRSTALKDPEVE